MRVKLISDLGFFFESLIEPPNFPFWELYVFFVLLLFVSIIFRLARIEKKVDGMLTLKELQYKYYRDKDE